MYVNLIVRVKNNNVEATEIIDLMQKENNRILRGSVIIIDNYFGSRCYERYCSQLRATPSAGCNISHSTDYLSNYLLSISAGMASLPGALSQERSSIAWLSSAILMCSSVISGKEESRTVSSLSIAQNSVLSNGPAAGSCRQ